MEKHDIIVIGSSAGSVPTLMRLVSDFPADLAASVFVVMHLPAYHKSELPAVLSRSGPLPAKHPSPVEPIRPGQIYVAPPDHHMLIDEGTVQLWRGPKENRHRPSINALFRSAAVFGRERVVGVILSGLLEDGATGLWWIKRFGGLAAVQEPNEAPFAEMPDAAIENVSVDYVAGSEQIGGLLVQLTMDGAPARQERR